MDKIFEPYLKELVTGRTEEVAWAAEKLPEFKEEMEQLKELRDELAALVGEGKAGELITAARGADVPIYEYCYRAGLDILLSCRAGGRHSSERNDRAVEEVIKDMPPIW